MKVVEEAIVKLTAERSKLDAAILALGHLNNFADANVITKPVVERRKRRVSREARAKMKLAQQRRWAKWRKAQGRDRG